MVEGFRVLVIRRGLKWFFTLWMGGVGDGMCGVYPVFVTAKFEQPKEKSQVLPPSPFDHGNALSKLSVVTGLRLNGPRNPGSPTYPTFRGGGTDGMEVRWNGVPFYDPTDGNRTAIGPLMSSEINTSVVSSASVRGRGFGVLDLTAPQGKGPLYGQTNINAAVPKAIFLEALGQGQKGPLDLYGTFYDLHQGQGRRKNILRGNYLGDDYHQQGTTWQGGWTSKNGPVVRSLLRFQTSRARLNTETESLPQADDRFLTTHDGFVAVDVHLPQTGAGPCHHLNAGGRHIERRVRGDGGVVGDTVFTAYGQDWNLGSGWHIRPRFENHINSAQFGGGAFDVTQVNQDGFISMDYKKTSYTFDMGGRFHRQESGHFRPDSHVRGSGEIIPHLTLTGSYASGHTDPGILDLYDYKTGEKTNPSPHPVQTHRFETGVNWHNPALPFNWGITVFRITGESLVTDSRTLRRINGGGIDNRGMEGRLTYGLTDHDRISLSYTWLAIVRGSVIRQPPHRLTLEGRKRIGDTVSLFTQYDYGSKSIDQIYGGGSGHSLVSLPPFHLVSVGMCYGVAQGIFLTISGQNVLFNRHEFVYGYGGVDPSLSVGIKIGW